MATLLYIDAYISPGGTGLMYVTGGSRILFAVGEMHAGPRWLMLLNKAKAPWLAVLIMWVAGILFLLPFPAWQLMVNYITSITVLTYGLGPIVLLVMRRNQPHLAPAVPAVGRGDPGADRLHLQQLDHLLDRLQGRRPSCSASSPAASRSMPCTYYYVAKKPREDFGWRYIAWLLPWFGGMWVLSALSDVGGGFGVLGFWPGVVLVAIWSLFVIALALRSALPAVGDRQDHGAHGDDVSRRRRRRRAVALAVLGMISARLFAWPGPFRSLA